MKKTKLPLHFITVLLVGASLGLLCPAAKAAEEPNGRINYSWIDDSGAISPKKWPAHGKWVTKKLMSDETFERPALEVTVDIPDSVVIKSMALKADQGFLNAAATVKNTIVFDTFSPLTILHLSISENKGPEKDLNLLVLISNAHLLTVKDKKCDDENISITTDRDADSIPYLYFGLKCAIDADKKLTATLYWSSDLKLVKAFYERAYGLGKFAHPLKTGKFFATFRFDRIAPPDSAAPVVLGHYVLSSTTSSQVMSNQDIALNWKPPIPKTPSIAQDFGKRIFTVPSLGFSSINYAQDGIPSYSEIGLTGKVSVTNFIAPPYWDLDFIAYLTLATLTANTAGVSARFLGINGRIGYHFDPIGPWSFSVFTGIYYTTMFVTNSEFGFTNMMGPLLFPAVKRSFGKNAMTGYIKYSPVAQGLGMDFGNREVAVGLGFQHPLPSDHTVSANLDYSNDSLHVQGVGINASSLSISVGFSF